MTDLEFIAKEVQNNIREFGQPDIVVGIPSFNNASTIGNVVRTVNQGLQQFFPSARSVIVNSDGGSKDGSAEQALCAARDEGALLQLTFHP